MTVSQVVLTPISEDYGRKITFTVSAILLYLFQIPIALAPNYATLIICRFIAGFVASPIFNVSTVYSDPVFSLKKEYIVLLQYTRLVEVNRRVHSGPCAQLLGVQR